MRLIEIAELCEKATGPDRTLDAAIYATRPSYRVDLSRASGLWPRGCDRATYERIFARRNAPAYTASLDAAMALVPEGAGFTLQQLGMPCMAEVCLMGREGVIGIGDTPALALCAAALRARAALQNADEAQAPATQADRAA